MGHHQQAACVMLPCYHTACFLHWGLRPMCLPGWGGDSSGHQAWLTHIGNQEAGVPCSDHGPFGESSPQEGHGNRSPLPQKERCLPATGTSQTVILDAVCGPVGVGVKAACRGAGPQRAQWSSQHGGAECDWGAPPRAGVLESIGTRAAEPAHCFVYKSPPFLLSLLSPSPHLSPFLNSSQTTPAFRLQEEGPTGGREAPGLGWERSQGRSGEGGESGKEGVDCGPLPCPTCCATPCVLLDGRDHRRGVLLDQTGWEREAWRRWDPGRRVVFQAWPLG